VNRQQSLEDTEFRIRPRRPRVAPDENKPWSRSFKALIHLARMTSRRTKPVGDNFGLGGGGKRKYRQRCAVRITYSPNRVRGQWAAHGRYISRQSAARQGEDRAAGFSANADGVEIVETLNAWQSAGDQRLFKLIVSPEFGERLDLRRHTRDLLARMERDLGTRLEWVAVAHFNTGHPHVHVALRGRTEDGPLRLSRDYIKQGIRNHAEELCTAQLGFRTELDALEAERREVDESRLTSLDRRISRHAFTAGDGTIDLDSLAEPRSAADRARRTFLVGRLRKLAVMGLAEEIDTNRWHVDPTFLHHLRAMQNANDRQKIYAARSGPNYDRRGR
jgi:type IV secretory pathway VirD2 relaxase